MANYANIKATINASIKQNGNEEITGPVLNSVLTAIVDSLGAGFLFMGVASTSTDPGTPDQNVCYIAGPGTYANFGGLIVNDDEVAVLKYDGAWTKEITSAASWAQIEKIDGFLHFTTARGGVDYSNGNITTSSAQRRTNYIYLGDAKRLRYTRGAVASVASKSGMCFFDENKNYLSGQRFILGEAQPRYEITEIDVPTGAVYARFSFLNEDIVSDTPFVQNISATIPSMEQMISEINERVGNFSGKKISIIGDSISCFGNESQTRNEGYNAPFWVVKSIDVGRTIESWVTWLDVYTSVNGTTPTNKTIGGVTLTPAMIGTLQSFTPIADDIGKEIGVARWAGNYTAKPWWSVLIDAIGAELCNNASWSGARIIPVPAGNPRHDAFVLSEAYSEYTLGRLAKRDDNGNIVTPDIIIIYRGTNDFSAEDPEGGTGGDVASEDLTTPDMMSFSGITDPHNFTQGYIWTILKIREKYPNAYVVLCTLNVFKRVNYSKFPSNNGTYTLPDYNNKIREIADLMGCGLIQFDKDGITFENCYPTYISDSSNTPLHPNTTGHRVMGERAVSDMRYAFTPGSV